METTTETDTDTLIANFKAANRNLQRADRQLDEAAERYSAAKAEVKRAEGEAGVCKSRLLNHLAAN